MTNVLFIADQQQRVRSQLNLIKKLLDPKYELFITIIIACKIDSNFLVNLEKVKIINFYSEDTEQVQIKKNFFYKLAKNTSIGQLLYSFILFKKMKKYLQLAEEQITFLNPDVVFVNGDRAGISLEQAFLRVAKQKKIKSIVPYTTVISDGISLRIKNFDDYSIKTILDKIVFFLNPSCVKSVNGKKIKFYDSSTLLILKYYNVLSDNPWMIGNGLADYICLDNQLSYNDYKQKIINLNKLKIVGDVEYDSLYEANNTKKHLFMKSYSLDNTKQNIIVAVPQLAEHNLMDWSNHWQEIDYILANVKKLNSNILLSLHPKMNRSNYEFLEKKYNCRIINEQLRDVLINGDLFIALNSSTVLWSVMLGIKTVVIDYFDLDSGLFKKLKNIFFVEKRNELYDMLEYILNSPIDFTNDWKLLSKNEVFDGNTIARYVKLINEMSSN